MENCKNNESILKETLSSVAMIFAPSTDIPRERALIGSSSSILFQDFYGKEFTYSDAIQSIMKHGELPELREETANTVFIKLSENNSVIVKIAGDKYKLNESFVEKSKKFQDKINQLFVDVVKQLFDTGKWPKGVIEGISQKLIYIIGKVLEKYGEYYAYLVAGGDVEGFPITYDDLRKICEVEIDTVLSPYISTREMVNAITELFRSGNEIFREYVFYLTQKYYYLRLLGIQGGLKYLTDNRFPNSIFLLDTNILFPFLFKESRHRKSIVELSQIAQKLNIKLKIAKVTYEEFSRIRHYQEERLKVLYDEVPDDLVRETREDMFRAYRNEKNINPDIIPDSFLDRFKDIQPLLLGWKIEEFIDYGEEKYKNHEFEKAKQVIKEKSLQVRKRLKTNASQAHDAELYFHIIHERGKSGEETIWLLTLDTSLPYVAKDLQKKGSVPFCMTLDGFLHIISPYVRIEEQSTFAELFFMLVTRNFSPLDEVISLDDLLMFSDNHHSIRHSEPNYVKLILRHVQNAIDQNLSQEERQKHIAYELQKALSNPDLKIDDRRDKKIKEQGKEIESLIVRMSANERKFELEKTVMSSQHTTEISELKNDISTIRSEFNDLKTRKENDDLKHQRTKKVNRIAIEILVSMIILGVVFLLPNYYQITHPRVLIWGILACAILFLSTEIFSEKMQRNMLYIFSGLGLIIGLLSWLAK